MAGLLKRLWQAMNGDLLGREQQLDRVHAELGAITYVGSDEKRGGYWEAELTHPKLKHKFSVLLPGTTRGPGPSQVAFVRATLQDLDELYTRCETALRAEYPKWTKLAWPADWKRAFILDNLEAPREGDRTGKWQVCFFAEPAKHYFTVHFENGDVREVIVDG
jgi:hypothetical protein